MKYLSTLLLFSLITMANAQPSFIDLDSDLEKSFQGLLIDNTAIAIGELHGTTEIPLLVFDLAKGWLEFHDSIIVALEISTSFQRDIDTFLKYGHLESLKSIEHFQTADGRSSVAMVYLIDELRKLGRAQILCFDIPWNSDRSADRDSLMGVNLNAAFDGTPMLILTGNLHATVDTDWMRPGVKSAVYHFKEMARLESQLISLNTYCGGGRSWNCQKEGCNVYGVGRYPTGETNGLKNFVRYNKSEIENGFNGIVYFNKVSASLPFFMNEDRLYQVMEKFKSSILNRDSLSFKKLFFTDTVPFVGVMSGLTELSIKKDYPDFQGLAVSNASDFISEVCNSERAQSEEFFNSSIYLNGPIANISFDYKFYSGERFVQWGHEKWNLVFTENQWLITDVIYSIHFPDVEACPF